MLPVMARPTLIRTQKRTRMQPEQRFAQLMDCAVRVFARRGLGEARHAEIAEEAGVSVSTVFFYFPTRDDLIQKVLARVSQAITEMAEVHHQANASEQTILAQHIDAFIRFTREDEDLAKVWMDWSTAIRDDIWPTYVILQEQIVDIICATIERGKLNGTIKNSMASGELARLMVGSAHMLASMIFQHTDSDAVKRFSVALHQVIVG